MKSRRPSLVIAAVLAVIALTASLASAQITAEKVAATNRILQQMKTTISKLPQSRQMMLGGYANISQLADACQAGAAAR